MNKYDENQLFTDFSKAQSIGKKQRIKGFYVCMDCGEFIKAIARPKTLCPFCKKETQLGCNLTFANEYATIMRWKTLGIYSDLRADVRERRIA